jgi:flavodoxin
MRTLIVYESAFGNTEKIAFALRDTVAQFSDVGAFRPEEIKASALENYDLIIVGSPTQKFNPLPGISSFLQQLPAKSLKGKKVAAFDTRVDLKKVNNRFLSFMVWLFGYAAEPIAKKLKGKGGKLIVPAEGFFVDDTKGPLTEGELERAKEWAMRLSD